MDATIYSTLDANMNVSVLPHYEVIKGNGPHLLMVHGILSSRAQWRDNLEALRAVCCPVVCELFGHGRSPSPTDFRCYSPEYYIACFEAIRMQIGIETWNVLGYSLGAGLTIQYCISHPQHITLQAFTNSTSAFSTLEATLQYRQNGDALIARYESGGRVAIEAIPVHPKYAKRLPDHVKAALLDDCKLLDPAGVARTIVHTNGYSSVRQILHKNTVPALLLCGALEERFKPLKEYARQNMPNLRIVDLEAGHAVNAEQPERFNRELSAFLNRDYSA